MTTKIIHISDLHFRANNDGRDELLAQGLAKLNERCPEHNLIITGDITDDGSREQYELAYAHLSPFIGRLFLCPGNHDYGAMGNFYSRDRAARFDEFTESLQIYAYYFDSGGPVIKTVNDGERNINIVGLDTNLKTTTAFDFACGKVGDSQLEHLWNFFHTSIRRPDINIVYLHHHPFVNLNPMMELVDRRKLMRIIYGRVNVLLFGHRHTEKTWQGERGIQLINSAGAFEGDGVVKEIVIKDPGNIKINDLFIGEVIYGKKG